MVYEVMDVCELKYPDNYFDIAIDKSTIDAILCGDNPYLNTCLLLKESQRVIKEDGGIYMAISYGKPATRSFHMERPCFSWILKEFVFYPVNFQNDTEKEEKSHYIYVCTKNDKWKQVYKDNFEKTIIELILHEKNQNLLKDDNDDEKPKNEIEDDLNDGDKVSYDIAKAKGMQNVTRPKSQ